MDHAACRPAGAGRHPAMQEFPKQQLQTELQVARRAGAADHAERAGTQRTPGTAECGSVGDIECFGAELNTEPLGWLEFPVNGNVQLLAGRPVHEVSGHIAERMERLRLEAVR